MKPVSRAQLCLSLFTIAAAVGSAAAQETEWRSLFNGADLAGWTPKIVGHAAGDNWNDTFRVEDGEIRVAYDKYEAFDNRFGHLFYAHPYSNYRFRMEYRFTGEQCPGGPGWAFRNSGVMVHAEPPESMRRDQDFPVSIEVQLLGGGDRGERTTGNLCTPGTNVVMDGELVTRHCTNSTSQTYRGDQWVAVEIEVRGNEVIRHLINGETVLEYTEPQLDPDDVDGQRLIAAANGEKALQGGYIALQSESHPVAFRNIEILPLGN